MMPTNERIEKLLKELEIEVTIGMLHKGVDENLRFQFIVPVSKSIKNGVVLCQFSARPIHRDSSIGQSIIDAPRLRVVDSNQSQ